MWNVFYPHFLINNVAELTPERLRELDVENLLLDVDCTLKQYENQEPEPEIRKRLKKIKNAGFKFCLLSNGVGKRIGRFAELIGAPYIAKACKPFPKGCRRAIAEFHFDPAKTVLVGDQIFADIMAGRLVGIRTILTKPISPEQEHWFTRIKRPFEKIVLRSFKQRFPDGIWLASEE